VAGRPARVELAELARSRGVAFRAESTVMSGTPVLSALVDGLAGAVPVALRGLLNATANFILSRMAEGRTYEDALAEAQRAGLAERDPAADVEGHDAVAKVMILSALRSSADSFDAIRSPAAESPISLSRR
jgi:homoserine dehydrogenase